MYSSWLLLQPAALDQILWKQAEQLFESGQYVESAMHYAKTRCSFEEVTLKFMALPEKNALANYLKKKLESLRYALFLVVELCTVPFCGI
jgi:hypothetical protein